MHRAALHTRRALPSVSPGANCNRGTVTIYINKAQGDWSHLLWVRSGFNKAPVMLVPQLDETSRLHQ